MAKVKNSTKIVLILCLGFIALIIYSNFAFAHVIPTNFTTPASWLNKYNSTTDVQSEDDSIIYSTGCWKQTLDAGFSGGSATFATEDLCSAVLKFNGLKVSMFSKVGPKQGYAKIYIDGVLATQLTLRAA